MITKESRRSDAVIDHLILRNSPIWQVYYAVKGRKSDMEISRGNSHIADIQYFES